MPDPDTDTSLPVVTITDFATGEAGKEVRLLDALAFLHGRVAKDWHAAACCDLGLMTTCTAGVKCLLVCGQAVHCAHGCTHEEHFASVQVILLVGGEHARELITSEIVYWLGKLLSGIDEELADWAAIESATAAAWKRGWAKGTLKEWADDLLKHVLFKVSAGLHAHAVSARGPLGMQLLCAPMQSASLHAPARRAAPSMAFKRRFSSRTPHRLASPVCALVKDPCMQGGCQISQRAC